MSNARGARFDGNGSEARSERAGNGSPAQLSLPLGDPRPNPSPRITENLFFAVLPSEDAKARIIALATRLQRRLEGPTRRVARECLHVSLRSLGEYPQSRPDIVARGKRVGASIEAAPFQVTFDRVLSFNATGGYSLVLGAGAGIDALTSLRKALGEKIQMAGLARRLRSQFAPHVTLLYCKQRIDQIDVQPITWTVRELVLVQGLYGQGRHVHPGRWPLRG